MKWCLIFLLFVSCSDFSEQKYTPDEIVYQNFFQKETLALLNQVRTENGLNTLKAERLVTYGAEVHAVRMSNTNTLSHFGFEQRAKNSKAKGFSEVISYNIDTPQDNINAFMSSQAHRNDLLGNYTHCGIFKYRDYLCIDLARYDK